MNEHEFNDAVVQRLYDEDYDELAERDEVASGRMLPTRVANQQAMRPIEKNVPHIAWAIAYWGYQSDILDEMPSMME